MNNKRFIYEIDTLNNFLQLHCHDKHTNQSKQTVHLKHLSYNYSVEIDLCDDCKDIAKVTFANIQVCPHEDKPKCRQCPKPCHDKVYWKKVAKIMRYSGIKLGYIKIKNKINKLLRK